MKSNNKKGKKETKKERESCGEFIWDTHDGAHICGLPSEYILCRRAMTGELCGVHTTMSSTYLYGCLRCYYYRHVFGRALSRRSEKQIDMVMI